ncbi:MAG: hypothetical protein CVU58_00135 [Deltaproteobacteria bacterium HGW-Deltaproteobacteria-16]|nr:MAG: hypothetical protein CVU58_00135 [Deltaproteobacteria bacterium HGW-Deltaproteobacteria-16]
MDVLLIVHKTTALSGGAGKFCAIRYYCQYVCSFSLLAQRKRTKRKGTQSLVPPQAGCPEFMPRMGYSSMLPGVCKLAALKQCKLLFRQLLRCSAA